MPHLARRAPEIAAVTHHHHHSLGFQQRSINISLREKTSLIQFCLCFQTSTLMTPKVCVYDYICSSFVTDYGHRTTDPPLLFLSLSFDVYH